MAACNKPLRNHSLAFAKELRYGFQRDQRKEEKHQHCLLYHNRPKHHMEIAGMVMVMNDTQWTEFHMVTVVSVEAHMKDILEFYMIKRDIDAMAHRKDMHMIVVHRKDTDKLFHRHHIMVFHRRDMVVARMKVHMMDVYREDMHMMVVYKKDVHNIVVQMKVHMMLVLPQMWMDKNRNELQS